MHPSDTRTATVTIQASSAAMGSVLSQILEKAAPCPTSDTHLIFAGCSGVFKCRLSSPVQRCTVTSYRCLRMRGELIHPTNTHVFRELKKLWAKFFGGWILSTQVRPSRVVEVRTVVNPVCFNRATHNPHHHPNVAVSAVGHFQQHSGADISPTCTEGFSDPRAFQGAVGKNIPPVPSPG